MDDSKIFMFPDGGTKQSSNDVNNLLPLLMCKADYLGSSVPDSEHLCKFVKDTVDDIDGYDGIAFNRWYADMCHKGIGIDWYSYR